MSAPIQPWRGAPWTPRDWQDEAIRAYLRTRPDQAPVIRAVTGAGKSIVIAEIAHLEEGRVVVMTPTVKLVDQLAGTLRQRGMKVGRYYTYQKDTRQRVIVCCNDSLASLAEKVDPPELWIVDEAHRSENDQVHDVVLGPADMHGERDASLAWVPQRRVGFTATPYRADDSEALSLFDVLAYDYGPAQAIKDGVVVRPRVRQYEGRATTIDEACVEMIQKKASGPGIVDAINISDAQEFAETLRSHDIRAKTVHSRLHDGTIAQRLRKLEAGELDCVVHVSLLSEGVDLPWLRWLCCRRPIGSKVLFAQYIGRGLRQSGPMQWGSEKLPRKKVCEVFDPNDLFGKLSLDYEAVLSGDIAEDETIPELPALEIDWALEDLKDSNEPPETLRGALLTVIDPLVAYVRRVHLALQFMGLVSMKIGAKDWREEAPTSRQLTKLVKDAWVLNEPDVPELHRRHLTNAIRTAEDLDRGTCSDLISILEVLKYGWPHDIEEEIAA